jgi:hypothetical protein
MRPMNAYALLVCVMFVTATACGQTLIHVSPVGNDSQPGTKAAPLATLAGARDRLRTLDKADPITVVFAEGTYQFARSVKFAKQDSGAAEARITYKAADGAKVRFVGGVEVTDWKPVTDEAVLKRLAPEARKHIRVADLKAQGLTDLGKLPVYGFGMKGGPVEAELSFGSSPLTLARWPNEGFARAVKKIDLEHVELDTDRMARWAGEQDPWIFAYWHHNWAELYEPIVGMAPAKRMIERSADIEPKYGITAKNVRWYALNLLSELDTAGEYYIDRTHGRAYLWPPKGTGPASLSQATGFIGAEALAHVTFQGITMQACRGTAIQCNGGADVQVVGCTIRNVGGRAVSMNGGTDHMVYGCDISDCGAGGISVSGGDRPTLTPPATTSRTTISTTTPAATAPTRVRSNSRCRHPHRAQSHSPRPAHGHLRRGGTTTSSSSTKCTTWSTRAATPGLTTPGRDWTQRGTHIRYNHWHNIAGAVGHGGMVIYEDDQNCGQLIYGNVFEHAPRAVFLGGGRDHRVTDNVFLNCYRSVHLDDRGMNWQSAMTRQPDQTLQTRLRRMPYQNELWRRHYPQLADILNDDVGLPKRNVFKRNISAGGTWDDIKEKVKKHQTIEDNLVFDDDPGWVTLVKDEAGKLVSIRFRDAAAVKAIGFKPIPVERIGLYEDARRASWPVKRQVERITTQRLRIDNAK